jgi:hypothetical protein
MALNDDSHSTEDLIGADRVRSLIGCAANLQEFMAVNASGHLRDTP